MIGHIPTGSGCKACGKVVRSPQSFADEPCENQEEARRLTNPPFNYVSHFASPEQREAWMELKQKRDRELKEVDKRHSERVRRLFDE